MGTRFHGAYACSDACFPTRRTDTATDLDYTRAEGSVTVPAAREPPRRGAGL